MRCAGCEGKALGSSCVSLIRHHGYGVEDPGLMWIKDPLGELAYSNLDGIAPAVPRAPVVHEE
jgi:hypothetical protein